MTMKQSCAAALLVLLLSGCGSSGSSSSSSSLPVVSAQTTYSNASVTGTYSVVLEEGYTESLIGSFKADGNGNITAGTFTDNQGAGSLCSVTASGTYSLGSSASGTATITFNSTGNCIPTRALNFNLQAGAQGNSLQLATGVTPSNWMFVGTATKQ
jgi:hypothetical protein